jgi:choline dehydrogenase-like flavoprotein
MAQHSFDYVIVGSGTGGSILARDLSFRGKKVLVIEGGKHETHIGTFSDCQRYFDSSKVIHIPKKAKEGAILWRTFMVGGSSVVSCGNGVRSLEEELNDKGIHLEAEYKEAEEYSHTALVDERLLSDGSRQIRESARELGYRFELMPKIVDPNKCQKCHSCSLGCRYHARWTGMTAIDEALRNGAEILTETWVDHVIVNNGKVKEVAVKSLDGSKTLQAKAVILAAGGLGTPVILQRSGIKEAGFNLFIDMFINVYGATNELNLIHEPQMALVDLQFHQEQGFLLSPYVNLPGQIRFLESGVKASLMSSEKMLGLMIKTRDDGAGRVFPDGNVSKPVTPEDQKRLDQGYQIAKEILLKVGADPKSITRSQPQGAHPGGTAAIGSVVDNHLQTHVEGLFVCDASVLPSAPGLPPIITIIALAKWLAKRLP